MIQKMFYDVLVLFAIGISVEMLSMPPPTPIGPYLMWKEYDETRSKGGSIRSLKETVTMCETRINLFDIYCGVSAKFDVPVGFISFGLGRQGFEFGFTVKFGEKGADMFVAFDNKIILLERNTSNDTLWSIRINSERHVIFSKNKIDLNDFLFLTDDHFPLNVFVNFSSANQRVLNAYHILC